MKTVYVALKDLILCFFCIGGIKDVKIQMFREIFQCISAADAVAFFVKCRSIDSNSHTASHTGQDSAADTAFGWDSHTNGKFPGTVVHAAGQHKGF